MKYEIQRGFTLIEIIVTIFILGVMVVLYASASSLFSLTRQTRQKDIALRIVNQKMESLRAATYAGIPSSGTFSDPLLSSLPNGAASTTITDYNADTKQVVVSVAWQEGSKPLRYLSITTLVTKVGGL